MRVTHPFHPLAGGEFEFVKRCRNWGADRVLLCPRGELVALPAEWTDAVAAGRAPFHIDGLLGLSELVARLAAERPLAGWRRVKRTTP